MTTTATTRTTTGTTTTRATMARTTTTTTTTNTTATASTATLHSLDDYHHDDYNNYYHFFSRNARNKVEVHSTASFERAQDSFVLGFLWQKGCGKECSGDVPLALRGVPVRSLYSKQSSCINDETATVIASPTP